MRTIGLVVYPGFSTINFSVMTVFETANLRMGEPAYDVRLLSERGGAVATSLGNSIETQVCRTARGKGFDTLMVAGDVAGAPGTPGLARCIRGAAARARRVASICTGAMLLAEAGLLNGRRVTTHWFHAAALRTRFPAVTVDVDRIFTKDGAVWTSAGMTAGVDLALAMVEEDLGKAIARDVAKLLVVYHRRGGGQSQHSTLLEMQATSDRVQSALAYAREHLHGRLSVEDLAGAVYLGSRQFSRLFRQETGQTPAKAIERLRVEGARAMMEEGRFSAREIARRNGFGNRERMRRSFVRALGVSPQALQRLAG